LLQALLAQHPDVYASATSPALEYVFAASRNYDTVERRAQPEALMQQAFAGFVHGGLTGYYKQITDKPVVVDKSRGWLEHMELLWLAYPEARCVCMTRNVGDILASLERAYQSNLNSPEARQLPTSRAAREAVWLAPSGRPLGLALSRLAARQARGADSRFMYLDYDDLVDNPIPEMQKVFAHLQLPSFEIDPENVVKAAEEDDSVYGIFGNHAVRPQVRRK
jgi:sulfotransferase